MMTIFNRRGAVLTGMWRFKQLQVPSPSGALTTAIGRGWASAPMSVAQNVSRTKEACALRNGSMVAGTRRSIQGVEVERAIGAG
jgi:hypothetical protein